MKSNKNPKNYLSGELFSGSLRVKLDAMSGFKRGGLSRRGGRNSAILELVGSGERVLHIGCADHPPLIPSKIAAGSYLHQLIAERVSEGQLWGLDSNLEGLEVMTKLGYENLVSDLESVKQLEFEKVLLPDTLEHLQNPGDFLSSLTHVKFKELVVTVPNAYSLGNRFFFRGETINSDHRSLHSPYSLSRLLVESGFCVNSVSLADYWGFRQPLRSLVKFLFPITREHLIITASIAHG